MSIGPLPQVSASVCEVLLAGMDQYLEGARRRLQVPIRIREVVSPANDTTRARVQKRSPAAVAIATRLSMACRTSESSSSPSTAAARRERS